MLSLLCLIHFIYIPSIWLLLFFTNYIELKWSIWSITHLEFIDWIKSKHEYFDNFFFFVCFFGKITVRIDVCGQRGQQLPTISTCYSGCVRERHIDPTSTYYLSGINVLLFSLLSSVEFVLFKNSDRRKKKWSMESRTLIDFVRCALWVYWTCDACVLKTNFSPRIQIAYNKHPESIRYSPFLVFRINWLLI